MGVSGVFLEVTPDERLVTNEVLTIGVHGMRIRPSLLNRRSLDALRTMLLEFIGRGGDSSPLMACHARRLPPPSLRGPDAGTRGCAEPEVACPAAGCLELIW